VTPEIAEFAWEPWLAAYVPKGVPCWTEIASFVRESASAYFSHHAPAARGSAQSDVRAIVDLAAFQHGKAALTRRTVFSSVTVQQFDQDRRAGDRRVASAASRMERPTVLAQREASNGTRHSHLAGIGRVLNPGGGWGPAKTTHRRFVTAPYTPDEVAWLEDCVARNDGLARVNGEALLVLGLGAGLAGRDLLVQARDCHVIDRGVEIHVRGRRVPVLARYEARLRALLADAEPDRRVIGSQASHKNAVNEAVARVQVAEGGPALETGRLRNTWLLGHLAAGTDVKALMQAAGLKSMTPISDFAAFLPDLSPEASFAMLRIGGRR